MSEHSAALSPRHSRAVSSPVGATQRPRGWGVWGTLAWTGGGIFLASLQPIAEALRFDLPLQLESVVQCMVSVAVITMVVLATRLTGIPVPDYLGLARPRVRDILRGVGCGAVAYIASMGLFVFLAPLATPSISLTTPMAASIGGFDKALAILTTLISGIVAGPIAEELLFRGFMYRGLESRLGGIAALLVTSVTFGLLHKIYGYGWDWVVVTCFLGLLCGWLRRRSGGVILPIVTHATYNVFGTALVAGGIFLLR
jgi:membrane protease YdiL (CAAX protease family)